MVIHNFEDSMSSSSNDIGQSKLIEMDIETDPNLLPVASKPCTLPLKCLEWVRKEVEDLEKAGNIQRSISPYASPIVVVPRKRPPGSPCARNKKTLC